MALKDLTSWLGFMVTLLAGGFLAVATFGYAPTTVADLGFAVSIGLAALGLAKVALAIARREKPVYGILGGAIALLAGWTIVATSVFGAVTASWLTFASALGYIGISTIGMVNREVTTDRVVHLLEVGNPERAMEIVQ